MHLRRICFVLFGLLLANGAISQHSVQQMDKLLNEASKTLDADPARCLEVCNEGLKINEQAGLPKYDGKFYGYLGILYQNLGNYPKALDCLIKSRKAALAIDDKQALISAEVNLGSVYFYQGKFDDALKQFIHAGNLARSYKNYAQAGSIVGNLAAVYVQMRQYDKALEYFKLAEKDFLSSTDSSSLATNYQNVGQVLLETHKYDTALKVLDLALRIATKIKNQTTEARINTNLAAVYFGTKQYQKTKHYLEEALRLHSINADSAYYVGIYCSLSEVNQQLGSNKIALANGNIAYDIAVKMKSNHWLKIASDNLNKVYSSIGDYKNAYIYGQKSAAYSDSIITEQKTREIQTLQVGFDTEKKEREIQQLSLEAELKNRQFWVLIGGGSIILLLIAAFAFVAYRNKKKTDRLNAALTATNAVKDQLFSIISHDLRSPLSSLQNFVVLLDRQALSEENFDKLRENIRQSLSSTAYMLDNLLQWANSQMGGIQIRKMEVNVCELANENINLYKEIADKKNINIHNSIPTDKVVLADENILRFVFRNLIANAVKFTPAGGQISIYMEGSSIHIKDTGIGLNEEMLSSINDIKIAGIKSSKGTAGEKGTGLGLMLCKEFLFKHGGQLKAESRLGEGSRFIVSV